MTSSPIRIRPYVLTAAMLWGFWGCERVETEWAVRVNGETISPEEFNLAVETVRPEVIDYFRQKDSTHPGPEFWDKSINGEFPSEVAMEFAMDRAVRAKTLQILARRQGREEDVSYEQFIESFRKEKFSNEDRSDPRLVFGPLGYTGSGYAVGPEPGSGGSDKSSLSRERRCSENELKKMYASGQYQFLGHDSLELEIFTVPYAGGMGTGYRWSSAEMLGLVQRMQTAAAEGKPYRHLKKMSARYGERLKMEAVRLGSSNAGDFGDRRPTAYEAAMDLGPGETSPVLEERGAYLFVRCLARRQGARASYDAAREKLGLKCIQRKIQKRLDSYIDRADIETNEGVIMGMRMSGG